jgi:hypothetical protein
MTTQIDTILLSATASLAAPDLTRLTTQAIAGTGVFDVLMNTVKLHLTEEYESDRITGAEYTNVYIAALDSVMKQSVQFLLNTQQEEKIQADIGLIRQKTVTELAQTDDTIPVGLGFNGDTVVEGVVSLQRDKLEQEELLVEAQVDQVEQEGNLIGQKVVTELAQTCDNLDNASVAGLGYNDNASGVIEGLVKSQKDKLAIETDLLEQKVVTEVSQTSDTKPTDLGQMTGTTAITGLVDAQKDKTGAEVTLLAQKANTELAQTDDSAITGAPYLNTSTSVTGVISKQKALFTAQTDGFARDAEQKVLKAILDTWSVGATLDQTSGTAANGLDSPSILEVVNKAKDGIGL